MKTFESTSCFQKSAVRSAIAACAAVLGWISTARSAEVDLTPISGGDGVYSQITVAGQTAWQNTGTSRYLYARRPNSFAFTTGQTLYVRVTYFDDAAGTIDLQFDAQTSNAKNSTLHTRTTRVNTGRFVDCFFELPDVRFTKSLNGSDFRIVTGTTTGAKVPVSRITLSDTPFADPDFQLAVARAWQTRYTGPAKDYVDTTTLKGKVMTGYQGWFGTPNDLDDNGTWRHWGGSTMTPEKFTIDMWPDLTEYDPSILARAADVVTGSGEPAYLFSSRNYAAVLKHFRWMRKHNIDGAWVQRFNPDAGSKPEWVLRNVSQAAAEEGRIWGVEYDVSSLQDATVAAKLQADWEWLTTQFDILNDPRYVHEGGKPVVFIWGLSVPDRGFSIASADAVVDYFQAQGVHVIGGLPTSWNSLSAAWKTHIEKYDGVLVWQNTTPADAAFFRGRGQDFYPHIWPGFSWAHLKKLPATPLVQYTDRAGGQFYWNKGRDWINAGGADSLFIGMFDEYDEGTAIMPMTDDPPPPYTEWGRFINNQGKPSDWWMMLSDELKRMMWNQRANTGTLPTVASLANRSNLGAEASVDLGTTDVNASLSRVQQADGNTIVETVPTVGGKECRGNASPTTTHRYLYFNVNNSFAYQLVDGDVTIEVEYFDSFYGSATGTTLGLQYDSTSTVPSNPAYTTHPQPITTTNSGTWRTVRFEIANAYFGGRQNGSSDFRLSFGGKKLNVNRVWVRLPEGKAYPFTWTNATSGPALNWSQNANWLGGIVGQSDPTSTVRFFPGQTMPGGAIPISNNLTGQQFNTLELSGTAASAADTTVTLTGNAFSLGGTTPGITLDATRSTFDLTYDLAAAVTLLGTVQLSGTGDANLRISGALSGSGGLTKTSTGLLTLTGTNSYQGGTQLNTGIIAFGSGSLGATGNISFLANSTLRWSTGNTQDISSRLVMSNGVTSTLDTNGNDVSFGSAIGNSSSAALVKTGTGTLTLSQAHTYTGNTTVSAGTLTLSNASSALNANPGNDASTVTIAATGATLNLTYTGTDKVDKLFIGGVQKADGVYGKSGSASPIISIPQITGNGTLTVGIVPPPGFAAWISGPFTGGATVPPGKQGPNDDPDNDGIRNLIEYAIAGEDPTVSNSTIGTFTGSSLSFAKRPGTTGLTYAIQQSADLGATQVWAELPPSGLYVNDTDTISYSFTPGTPEKNFLRLKVISD